MGKKVSYRGRNMKVRSSILTIKMAVSNENTFAWSFVDAQKADHWHVIVAGQTIVGYVGFYTDHNQQLGVRCCDCEYVIDAYAPSQG